MTRPRLRPRRPRVATVRAVAAALVAALALSACTTPASPGASTDDALAPSLATSIDTSSGQWAVVPMGRIGQPLNTFWQLLYRSSSTSRWVDLSEPLAVATNGGIVMSRAGAHTLEVGVRPADRLSYSALLAVGTAGTSWTPLTPVSALAPSPSALSVGTRGAAAALVQTDHGTEVQARAEGGASWSTVGSTSEFARTVAGRTCDPTTLSAVSDSVGRLLVGADCRQPGVVGVVSVADGRWTLTGPRLPLPLRAGPVDVLGILPAAHGVSVVLDVRVRGTHTFLVARTTDGGATWDLSRPVAVGSTSVTSIGPAGTTGVFLLLGSPTGAATLVEDPTSGARWITLPRPPPTTWTISFSSTTSADALATDGDELTDWRLVPGGWHRHQGLHVTIEYGSSS